MSDIASNVVRPLRQPIAAKKIANRRLSANWLAALVTSTDQILCIVEDISARGAKLRVGLLPQSEEAVTLAIADYEPIAGLIAWRSGDRIGLTFSEQQPFLEELLAKAAKQAVGAFIQTSNTRKGTLANL